MLKLVLKVIIRTGEVIKIVSPDSKFIKRKYHTNFITVI